MKDEIENRQTVTEKFPRFFVTGFEYVALMKEIGISIRVFAEHIQKSENFVRQSLGYQTFEAIPIRWVEALEKYVGKDVFDAALARFRSRREHAWYYVELAERREWKYIRK